MLQAPTYASIMMLILTFVMSVPIFYQPSWFYLVISFSAVAMYVAYALPVVCK
jgi:hypothetical protein